MLVENPGTGSSGKKTAGRREHWLENTNQFLKSLVDLCFHQK
jgi:hypothetical protein